MLCSSAVILGPALTACAVDSGSASSESEPADTGPTPDAETEPGDTGGEVPVTLPLFEELTTKRILASDCETLLDAAGTTYQYGVTVPLVLVPGETPSLFVVCTISFYHSGVETYWDYSGAFYFGPELLASKSELSLADAELKLVDGYFYYDTYDIDKYYERPLGHVIVSHGIAWAGDDTETFFIGSNESGTGAYGADLVGTSPRFHTDSWPQSRWEPVVRSSYPDYSDIQFAWIFRHGSGQLQEHEEGEESTHAVLFGRASDWYEHSGAAYLVDTAEHLSGTVFIEDAADQTIKGLLTTTIGYGPLGFMGDLDGDGLDDLYSASAGCSITGPLAVPNLVIITADTLRDVELTDTSIADVRLCGSSGYLGDEYLVAAPGDLDGDGYAELAYATPDAGERRTGRAYLLRGDTWRSGGYADLSEADVRIIGTEEDAMVGAGLSEVADQDGDGVMELVLSGGYPPDDRINGFLIGWSGRNLPASGTLEAQDADVQLGGWPRSEGGLHTSLWDTRLDGRFDFTGDGRSDLLVDYRTGTSLILEDWWVLAD